VAKKVTDVAVEINELALSLLGWEVQDFRARVTTEQYAVDGNCFHKLAVSGVFRFNDADWVDRFSYSREYPTSPVVLLSSSSISNRPAICRLHVGSVKNGRPVRVADDDWFINTYHPIDHRDLQIELTAYDSVDSRYGISDIPLQVKEIPIEVVDESSPSSVRLTFDQIEAFTHRKDGDQDDTRLGLIRAAGRVTFGAPDDLLADWVSSWRQPPANTPTVANKAPFSRGTPNLMFDVLDDTGFLLEQIRGDIDITVHVDECGHAPSRAPRWLLDLRFDPDGYSAPPSRIIGRLEDD
jgi:hypothetical protein